MKHRVWAVLLAAAMGLGLLAGCGETGGGNMAVYLTDENEFQLLKGISADSEPIELTDRAADPSVYEQGYGSLENNYGTMDETLMWLSKDGKTLYFLARIDGNTATLYRAELDQLKADSDKNDTYVEKVDSSVYVYSVAPTADGLIYAKSGSDGRRLYYYNGQDSTKLINGNWEEYWPTEDGAGVVYQMYSESDGSSSLYYQPLSGDEREKLAANVSSVSYTDGVLLYTRYRDDGRDVYAVAPGEEPTLLVSGVNSIQRAAGKRFYYTVEKTQEIPLSQFVDDPNAPAGSGSSSKPDATTATEPMMSDMEDYRLDPDRNSVEEYERLSGESYADWCGGVAQSDPEMELAFKNQVEMRWGTLYDNEAYERDRAAYDAWYEAGAMDQLRGELKECTISVTRTQLSFFNGTDSALVCDDLSTTSYLNAAAQTAIYTKKQRVEIEDKISINAISWVDEVYNWYDQHTTTKVEEGLWYYTIGSAAEGELELDSSWNCVGLLDGKDLVLRLEQNSELVSLPIADGALGKPVSIAEDVPNYQLNGEKNAVYYYSNVSDGTGDLRRYQNGTSEVLAKDVSSSTFGFHNCVYSDGVVLAVKAPSSSGGTLTRFQNGESTRLADDVTRYLRLDGQKILYLSDGNLYLYDGKEKQRLSSDVSMMWSPNAMTGDWL